LQNCAEVERAGDGERGAAVRAIEREEEGRGKGRGARRAERERAREVCGRVALREEDAGRRGLAGRRRGGGGGLREERSVLADVDRPKSAADARARNHRDRLDDCSGERGR
jgi:hypothetical protein